MSETPKADPRRIAQFIREIDGIGRDPEGGWWRPAFGPEEREAHAVFDRYARGLGMEVATDAVGNTIASLPGEDPGFVCGSHLDTVPRGGGYDGVAGVAASLEVARLLRESGNIRHAYRAVVFSGEEGARFGTPCIGSRVATGAFGPETLKKLIDRNGSTVEQCANEVGLSPSRASGATWLPGSVLAFIELHIEQGRVLESRGATLGIVDAIAGSTRIELTFTGNADHSGATPMTLRQDALVGAGEFVVEVERRTLPYRTAVATVGNLTVAPGSFTTVPGQTRLALDVRDSDSERQRELAEKLLDEAMRITSRRSLDLSAVLISDQSPVVLHKPVREQLAQAATRAGENFCVLASGASHDAAHVASVSPSGMVFVPSRHGKSHSPDEWSSVEDIARGADVIAGAFLALDEQEVL